jgi:hypothetical protein
MLAVSNNVLESFFRILKHILLNGLPCKTIFGFLKLWNTYQSYVVINRLNVNIVVRELLGRDLPRVVTTVQIPVSVKAEVPASDLLSAEPAMFEEVFAEEDAEVDVCDAEEVR